MSNIVDVETIGDSHGAPTTELTSSDWIQWSLTTEDIQKQNMADFAKFFDSLGRDKKRKIMKNRIRCKRLHPRVWTKKWVRQQITNRLSQCKS